MIITFTIIGLSFYWLLIESNYLRVRLLVGEDCQAGDCCQWHCPDNAINQDMKLWLTAHWNLPKVQDALFTQGNLDPLCGWGFAYQYRDFVPETTIELLGEGYHSIMHIKQPAILKDVMKVYRNPYIKIKLTAQGG